jgi:hypothetical protein
LAAEADFFGGVAEDIENFDFVELSRRECVTTFDNFDPARAAGRGTARIRDIRCRMGIGDVHDGLARLGVDLQARRFESYSDHAHGLMYMGSFV